MSMELTLVCITAGLVYLLYISLVMKRNKVREAESGIDVQLKKRHDLIPNLLQTAATFMKHESKLMEEITQLRTQAMASSFNANPQQSAELENMLGQKLKEFCISVENYPDLKSNQTMIQAMQSMADTEEHIAAARRFYNAAVNSLYNAVEIFPSNIIASMTNIQKAAFFAAETKEKQEINAGDYFK